MALTTRALVPLSQQAPPSPPRPPARQWQLARRGHMTGVALLSNSFHTLQSHRLRSLLTIFGITIGIAAVIAVVCLTQGVNEAVDLYFTRLGTNSITIIPTAVLPTNGVLPPAGSGQTLTLADSQAIAEQIPHIVAMSPVLNTSAQVIYSDQNWQSPIQGVYPNFQSIAQWQLDEGSWFSDQQEQVGAPVAVLGQTVAERLFGAPSVTTDPVGQTIRIRNQLFRVIGVLQAKGYEGASDTDNIIFVPFSAAEVRLKPSSHVDQIQVEVDTPDNIVQAQIDIITLLRLRHHLTGEDPVVQALEQQQGAFSQSFSWLQGKNNVATGNGTSQADLDDFQVLSNSLLIQTAQQDATMLEVLLVSIAAISLSVGGIGTMNIMLVSVTERTAEIGVCMAVGARQRDIGQQFLLEALILCMIGGAMGLILGLLGGMGLASSFGFPFIFSPIPMVVAFGVSASVGVVFGLYPAVRASRLEPMVALRAAF